MRLVTMSTALALSVAAFALSTPASAVTAKKEPVAKNGRVAASSPAKKTAAVAPTKKVAAAKAHRVAAGAPVKVKKAAVVRHRRVASVESPAASSADVMMQAPGEIRVVTRQEGTRTVSSARSVGTRMPVLFASADPVSEARRWIGTNPTDRNNLWCARFMNFVLERSGYQGTGSDAAKSFASYGQRISGPQVGAIAVLTRGRNGGHVGIVSGIDASGNPIIISGNHGHQVGEGVYSRSRVIAYVLPR